ncbi:MAG TPA: hypothetical protein VG845_15350 [Dehalococcoidia bacterium]|jgi:hypothetical protein|nr:hypothetical protein [Dehalococcoidia bacterium]
MFLAYGLAVIATLLLIVGNHGAWVRLALLDSDNFSDTVTDVLQEPEATSRISEVLAEQALASPELQARIEETLPREGPLLTSLLQNELENVVARSLQRILELEAIRDVLRAAISNLHSVLVGLLEGRRENITVEDDRLVLNLRGVLENLFNELGVSLPQQLQSTNAGEVVLMEDASSLDALGTLIRGIDEGTPGVLLLAFLGYVGCTFASPSRRRGIAISGFGILIAGIVCLLVWRMAGWAFGEFLNERPVARMLLDGLIESFRWQSLALVVLGVLLVVASDGRVVRWLSQWGRIGLQRADELGRGRVLLIAAVVLVILLMIF